MKDLKEKLEKLDHVLSPDEEENYILAWMEVDGKKVVFAIIEELGELIAAITKYVDKPSEATWMGIVDELVDVQIVTEFCWRHFGIPNEMLTKARTLKLTQCDMDKYVDEFDHIVWLRMSAKTMLDHIPFSDDWIKEFNAVFKELQHLEGFNAAHGIPSIMDKPVRRALKCTVKALKKARRGWCSHGCTHPNTCQSICEKMEKFKWDNADTGELIVQVGNWVDSIYNQHYSIMQTTTDDNRG